MNTLNIPCPLLSRYVLTINTIRTIMKYGQYMTDNIELVRKFRELDEQRQRLHDQILETMGKEREDSHFAFQLSAMVEKYIDTQTQ